MKCTNCISEKLFTIEGEFKWCDTYIPKLNLKTNDCMPDIDYIGSGDNLKLTVCLDCGAIKGFKSIKDKDLDIAYKVAIHGDDWEEAIEDQKTDSPYPDVAIPPPKLSANSPWLKYVK